jgi:hypothetical protein
VFIPSAQAPFIITALSTPKAWSIVLQGTVLTHDPLGRLRSAVASDPDEDGDADSITVGPHGGPTARFLEIPLVGAGDVEVHCDEPGTYAVVAVSSGGETSLGTFGSEVGPQVVTLARATEAEESLEIRAGAAVFDRTALRSATEPIVFQIVDTVPIVDDGTFSVRGRAFTGTETAEVLQASAAEDLWVACSLSSSTSSELVFDLPPLQLSKATAVLFRIRANSTSSDALFLRRIYVSAQ